MSIGWFVATIILAYVLGWACGASVQKEKDS